MPTFDTAIQTALSHSAKAPAYGFWLCINSAALAKTALRAAVTASAETNGTRYTWVLVDGEHGLVTDADYYALNTAIGAEGASPIVRIPVAEEHLIKRALDAGAHGVLTPMCHSAADAEAVVRWSKYPPVGTRGYGPLFANHSMPGVEGGAVYDRAADDSLIVAVQIESRQGVENVDAIAAVPGIDVLLLGPMDLSLQLGVAVGSPEHEAAIQRVLDACRAHGKKAAIFCSSGAQARQRALQGFDMISVITDFGAFSTIMAAQLSIAVGGAAAKAGKREGY